MKRIYLSLFFILFVFAFSTKAQFVKVYDLESLSKPRIGLRTGPAISKLSNGDADTDYRFGFNLGAAMKTPLSRHLSLQNELVFAKKGGSITYITNQFYTGKVRYNLYYLDLPILLKVRLGRAFHFMGGYQGSLLLDATIDYVDPYVIGFAELDQSELNSWDHSIVTGISFEGLKRSLGIRVTYGLTDVAKSDYANTFLGDAKNISIQFCFTRYFGRR